MNWARHHKCTHVGVHVKCRLFLSDFNETWIPKYKISRKSVQWKRVPNFRAARDRQMSVELKNVERITEIFEVQFVKSATWSTRNPTWTALWTIPEPRGEKMANNPTARTAERADLPPCQFFLHVTHGLRSTTLFDDWVTVITNRYKEAGRQCRKRRNFVRFPADCPNAYHLSTGQTKINPADGAS